MREPRKDEKLMIDECFKNGGFLANDVLQVVTSPCIIPRSFPPCLVSGPALLGVTKHSQCFWCPGIQPLPLGSQSSVLVLLQLCIDHRNCLTLLPVNPTSCSCWSDCVSVLEKERKINHIAACGMGQVSPLSLCLLPGHYRIN